MANFRTTNDLKKLALHYSGEMTDGTSSYDTIAMNYINSTYQAFLSGGNEFDMELAESWSWAKSRRPIVLTLEPPYQTGSVTMTNGSRSFTFSSAPTDVLGWLLKVDQAKDSYYIQYQSGTAGQLDQPFLGTSGTYTFKAIKTDYELVDDTIIVDKFNKYIDLNEGASDLLATLTEGVYTPTTYAAEVKTQLDVAGALTYTVSYDSVLRLFTISAGSNFTIKFATGTNAVRSAARTLGLSAEDLTGDDSYTSTNALNAIQRLIAPFTMYRIGQSPNMSPKEAGKIFGVSFEAFISNNPVVNLQGGIPSRFCELEERENGTKVVRFNAYVSEQTRVEVDFIPIEPDLKDNAVSVPKIPRAFREVLAFGATYKLMLDKSDNKAESFLKLTMAKIQGLINHNNTQVTKSSKDFARLIPRPNQIQRVNFRS